MSRHRIDFTQAELNRIAEAAAKYHVPMTIERIAPDGTKVIATANSAVSGNNKGNDLDQWLEEHRDASTTEGN